MDHSHMDHGGMGHGGMDHGDMGDMPAMCSMNMLFTWDTTNLCIVFRQWHIRSTASLLFSLLLIVFLTAGYEALRRASRKYENLVARRQDNAPNENTEDEPLFRSGQKQVEITKSAHVIKALFYAVQTFYAFMLMLIFMTYNGWVMFAMFIGAFVGYLSFGTELSPTREGSCH